MLAVFEQSPATAHQIQRRLSRSKQSGSPSRVPEFLRQVFVVPSLRGSEHERSAAALVKVGPTNSASNLGKHASEHITASESHSAVNDCVALHQTQGR